MPPLGARSLGASYPFVLSLLVAACSKPAPPVDAELATQRLCDQISNKQKRMIVNTIGKDTVWSDGALMERAAEFPAPLKALIDHPTETTDMLALLQSVDARQSEWRDATVRRTGEGGQTCEVTDGKDSARVNCAYTTYLAARYPNGKVRLQAPLEPVLFVVEGRIRALLMPMKP